MAKRSTIFFFFICYSFIVPQSWHVSFTLLILPFTHKSKKSCQPYLDLHHCMTAYVTISCSPFCLFSWILCTTGLFPLTFLQTCTLKKHRASDSLDAARRILTATGSVSFPLIVSIRSYSHLGLCYITHTHTHTDICLSLCANMWPCKLHFFWKTVLFHL